MKKIFPVLLTGLLIVLVAVVAFKRATAPTAYSPFHRLAESKYNTFVPVLTSTNEGFLAALPKPKGLTIYVLDQAGRETSQHFLTAPAFYQPRFLKDGSNLLVASGGRFIRLNARYEADGEMVALDPTDPLVEILDQNYHHVTYALYDHLLSAMVTANGKIYFRSYHLDGTPAGESVTFPASTETLAQGGLARLGDGSFLLVWDENKKIFIAQVSQDGKVLQQPREIYAAKPSGTFYGCRVSATPEGQALIVWSDSSNRDYEIFALRADATGARGGVQNISAGRSKKEGLRPQVLLNGQQNVIGWISGIRWGAFARGGTGKISLFDVQQNKLIGVVHISGKSIESFDFIPAGAKQLAFVAAAKEETQYGIYTGVLKESV